MSKRVEELLEKMTLDEKIGQLNQVMFDNSDELREQIEKGMVGSLILAGTMTAGNDDQERTRIDELNELQRIAVERSPSGIPMIYGRDVIHGHRVVLPIPLASAASFNPELNELAYKNVAEEAVNDGIHWTFSPMMDISRDPRWGRCIEGYGEDPYLAAKMASATVKGFQGSKEEYKTKRSIAACAKHYIGYGASEGGRDYAKAEITDYTLRNYYLTPFAAAVKSGVATVMSSFNEIGGQPLSSSRYLLHDLLKDELGFDGYIISDWAAVEQLVWQDAAENKKDAARLAANAELDMDMVDRCYIENLHALVDEGKVSEEKITEMARRVLGIKERFGLFDDPYTTVGSVDFEEHKRMAKKCADEAAVLLKNNGVLPLAKDSRAVLAGPFVREKHSLVGSWSPDYDPEMIDSLADVFEARGGNIHIQTFDQFDDTLVESKHADTIILALGESKRVTGEANSLSNIDLPIAQLELAKRLKARGKKVIGVMFFGRPIALEDAEPYFDAILYAWHGGTMAAHSAVDIIYGDVVPSGRLPMTLPRRTGQIPLYYNYPTLSRNKYSYYGEGESYHDSQSTPMYPFGYGLSYTTFEYSNIRCETNTLTLADIEAGKKFIIKADVKNTGSIDAKEVSQCYIHDNYATMTRPIKELKGFVKKLIKAGETETVSFELGKEELGFYRADRSFAVETGSFDIYVGPDCRAERALTIVVTE